MFILIDNYDSFTYNLVQYFGQLGSVPTVYRNDALTIDELRELHPTRLVISPGPCTPDEAGISCTAIAEFAGKIPIFGVCLGHQCIGQVFGAHIVRAEELMHGKTSEIYHDGKGVFVGLPNPFQATRYHSLVIDPPSLTSSLHSSAHTTDDVIMGIRHSAYNIEGVQFHPESILTKTGINILRNFLAISGGVRQ